MNGYKTLIYSSLAFFFLLFFGNWIFNGVEDNSHYLVIDERSILEQEFDFEVEGYINPEIPHNINGEGCSFSFNFSETNLSELSDFILLYDIPTCLPWELLDYPSLNDSQKSVEINDSDEYKLIYKIKPTFDEIDTIKEKFVMEISI